MPTKKIAIVTSDIDWNVQGFELSEDGARAAFTVNEGGTNRLYLMDPQTRRHERVERMPIGLHLQAAPFAEEKLLRAAHMFQTATDWHTRRPELT